MMVIVDKMNRPVVNYVEERMEAERRIGGRLSSMQVRRFNNCLKALEAALEFDQLPTWWAELAPLKKDERMWVKERWAEIRAEVSGG